MTSTVMPGDIEGIFIPALEASSGKKLKKDFGVCYVPQFIALGSVIENILYPDMVLIGESDPKTGKDIQTIYEIITANYPKLIRTNFTNAEIAKLTINAYITNKISFANTIGEICHNTRDADARVVLKVVGSDSRIGEKCLNPGLSFGGPCFPRDNLALSVVAEDAVVIR